MLYLHMNGFQITHGVKQCTMCQHTNYHDTTNHGLNCFNHVIYTQHKLAHTKILQNLWLPLVCVCVCARIYIFVYIYIYIYNLIKHRQNALKEIISDVTLVSLQISGFATSDLFQVCLLLWFTLNDSTNSSGVLI